MVANSSLEGPCDISPVIRLVTHDCTGTVQ